MIRKCEELRSLNTIP